MENEIASSNETATADAGASPNAKKPNAFLIVFLLLTVLGLVAIDIYQDRVIQKQRYEIRWLMTHGTFRPDPVVASDAKAQQPAAKPESAQAQASNVAPAQSPAKSAQQAAPHSDKP